MAKVRGVKALVDHLESIDCPMSESTIYRLLRTREIPCKRPTPGILIFDLNAIDRWLSSDPESERQTRPRLVERESVR